MYLKKPQGISILNVTTGCVNLGGNDCNQGFVRTDKKIKINLAVKNVWPAIFFFYFILKIA